MTTRAAVFLVFCAMFVMVALGSTRAESLDSRCAYSRRNEIFNAIAPEARIGDIVLRLSTHQHSVGIGLVTLSAFSHAGVVTFDDVDHCFYVVQAYPSSSSDQADVQRRRLDDFLASEAGDALVHAALYRPRAMEAITDRAGVQAGIMSFFRESERLSRAGKLKFYLITDWTDTEKTHCAKFAISALQKGLRRHIRIPDSKKIIMVASDKLLQYIDKTSVRMKIAGDKDLVAKFDSLYRELRSLRTQIEGFKDRVVTPADITRSPDFREIVYVMSGTLSSAWQPLLDIYSGLRRDINTLLEDDGKRVADSRWYFKYRNARSFLEQRLRVGTTVDALAVATDLYGWFVEHPQTYTLLCAGVRAALKQSHRVEIDCE